MEWEPAELRKEEAKARPKGGMATRELARREMAEEIARVQGRKRRDPRLETLERVAEAWQRKQADEEMERRLREKEKIHHECDQWGKAKEDTGIPVHIKDTPPKWTGTEVGVESRTDDSSIAGWLQQGLARWAQEKQPEGQKKGRRPNSATMSMILRRALAREKALAWGRPLANHRLVELEQEAAQWRQRKEEEKQLIRREIGMLQKLVELMARDEFLDGSKNNDEWMIGKVSCFADKAPQNGWNVAIVAVERSQFMVRWGWGDLLGVYHAELDDQLNMKDYLRVTPEDLEEYFRTKDQAES